MQATETDRAVYDLIRALLERCTIVEACLDCDDAGCPVGVIAVRAPNAPAAQGRQELTFTDPKILDLIEDYQDRWVAHP